MVKIRQVSDMIIDYVATTSKKYVETLKKKMMFCIMRDIPDG